MPDMPTQRGSSLQNWRAVIIGYKGYRTPTNGGSIYDTLTREFDFTMDAAASHVNRLMPTYCTPDGKFYKPLRLPPQKISGIKSGLDIEAWRDEVVWCNPPYDDILAWTQVAQHQVAKASVLLLPPSVDTLWWRSLIPASEQAEVWSNGFWTGFRWGRPIASQVSVDREFELRFWNGREAFWVPARKLPDESFDETCKESVEASSPRAGNLVFIARRWY